MNKTDKERLEQVKRQRDLLIAFSRDMLERYDPLDIRYVNDFVVKNGGQAWLV